MSTRTVTIQKLASETHRSESSLILWTKDIWPDRETTKNRDGVRTYSQDEAAELRRQSGFRIRRHKGGSVLYGPKPDAATAATPLPPALDPFGPPEPTAVKRDDMPVSYSGGEVIVEVPDAFRGMASFRGILAEEYVEQLIAAEVARVRDVLKNL